MAKILVVDDSNLSRRILRNTLAQCDHEVVEAADGISALERYFIEKPDLVLLDLTMQGMYGLDVLSKLRRMDPGVCVIVASADIQTQTRALAYAGGAVAYMNKPFAAERVLAVVNEALSECSHAAS